MEFRFHCHPISIRRIFSLAFSLLFLLLFITSTSSSSVFNLTTITFEQGYSPLFSDFNIDRSPDDKSVRLLLNRLSGSPPSFFTIIHTQNRTLNIVYEENLFQNILLLIVVFRGQITRVIRRFLSKRGQDTMSISKYYRRI